MARAEAAGRRITKLTVPIIWDIMKDKLWFLHTERLKHSPRHGSGGSPHRKAAGDGQDDLIVQDTCGPDIK